MKVIAFSFAAALLATPAMAGEGVVAAPPADAAVPVLQENGANPSKPVFVRGLRACDLTPYCTDGVHQGDGARNSDGLAPECVIVLLNGVRLRLPPGAQRKGCLAQAVAQPSRMLPANPAAPATPTP